MMNVRIYTDGACKGNPGPGGWAALLDCGDERTVLSGLCTHTTNNRMELTAVIAGLEALISPAWVTVMSDSKYVVDSVNNGWLTRWKNAGWRRNNQEPIPNADLWEQLLLAMKRHITSFVWVRGHNGNYENELCDRIASGKAQEAAAQTK